MGAIELDFQRWVVCESSPYDDGGPKLSRLEGDLAPCLANPSCTDPFCDQSVLIQAMEVLPSSEDHGEKLGRKLLREIWEYEWRGG